MQTATAAFATAVSRGEVTWAPRRVKTDWALDGYGGADTIDDLSGQIGSPVAVDHGLDDGLPDEVSFVAGLGVSEATIPLRYGRSGLNAAQYLSPWRTDSPVYTYPRDVAPVTVEVGVITSAGPEYVTVFTGQMAGTPVRGREGAVEAISSSRLALSKLVQPPAVWGYLEGANASWPITYAMHASGVYPSPPTLDGCRLHATMHGSAHPNIPNDSSAYTQIGAVDGTGVTTDPVFCDGPYVLGFEAACGASRVTDLRWQGVRFADGTDMLSQAGNIGRVEAYIRGDAFDLAYSSAPATSAFLLKVANGLSATTGWVKVGITPDRKLAVVLNDPGSALTYFYASTNVLPSDGEWHACGWAWNYTGNTMYTYLDGTLRSTTGSPAFSAAGLPAVEDLRVVDDPGAPFLESLLPVAELQVTSGAQANPAVNGYWMDSATWDQGAVVVPSLLELAAIAETAPREAWELIGSYAQSELAMLRTSEVDQVLYYPPRWWSRDAQQTATDTLSTAVNVGDLTITYDFTKIRNSARVSYTDTEIPVALTVVARIDDTFTLAPAETRVVRLLPSGPIVWAQQQSAATGLDETTDSYPTFMNFFVAYNMNDSSVHATSAEISITVTSWTPGEVVVTIANLTGLYWVFSSTKNWPVVGVVGKQLRQQASSVTVTDDGSVAVRGERSLPISLPAVQTAVDAARVGQYLVDDLGYPVAQIEQARVFGDPRRQPGDRVTFADAANTGADGDWRLHNIAHEIDSPGYTQTVTLRRTRDTGYWLADILVGVGTVAVGNNAAVSPALPAGVAAGDLMLVYAGMNDSSGVSTVVAPSGWSVLVAKDYTAILYRYYQAGDAAPTVAWSSYPGAGCTTMAQVVALRGVTATVHASATQTNASAQNVAYPALTVTADQQVVLVCGFKKDDCTSVATPTGFTLVGAETTTTGNDATLAWYLAEQGDAANIAAGSLVVTGGGSNVSRSIVVALGLADGNGAVWDGDTVWADEE